MNAHTKIRHETRPVTLLSLKMGADECRDDITARLEYVRAERVGYRADLERAEQLVATLKDKIAAIGEEEAQLLECDRIVSASQSGFERMMTVRG